MHDVPCVTLSDPGASRLPSDCARSIREALEELGFVRIAGHGIDPALIRDTYRAFAAFFALPDPDKQRCAGSAGGQRGFTGFGIEHARNHAVPDLKEFFHVGQSLPPAGAPASVYPDNVWPAEVPELEARARALFASLERCARVVLHGLAESYGLPGEDFASLIDSGNSVLRAVHYPAVAAPPAGALRAAPHEDINLITLLCGATGPGLEIYSQGRWAPVAHEPDEIVIDTGDMLSRLTNGVLPATTHRVVEPASSSEARLALPFFAHPRPECDLTARAPFVTDGRPRLHEPISAGRFLEERLREIGLSG
jgi:isopenicillin N synthase-like dioxygenase